MQVNRKDLQRALEIVKPGLANKELIEQSTSFAFIGDKVVTYNDEISISHPIIGLELNGAVKADKLYALLSKIKKDEIELTLEGNEVLITSGRSKAGFTLQEEIKLPLDEELTERSKWKDLPEGFHRLLNFAMPSCSREMSKPILTCVHVNKEGYIEASDSYRITRCDLGVGMPVDTFLIPATSVAQILRLDPLPNKISAGKGWMHFRNENKTILSCRLFEDVYPDTTAILRTSGVRVNLPKTINDVLERAGVFAKRDHTMDEIITISIVNGILKIRADADAGWFEERAKVEYSGEPLSFQITPYLLKGILKETLTCNIAKSKIKFEGTGWVYISMLRHEKEE